MSSSVCEVCVRWTDTEIGSALHDEAGKLVAKIRPLAAGGVSARWENGMRWDISDQAPKAPLSSSRWFANLRDAKSAIARELEAAGAAKAKEEQGGEEG